MLYLDYIEEGHVVPLYLNIVDALLVEIKGMIALITLVSLNFVYPVVGLD